MCYVSSIIYIKIAVKFQRNLDLSFFYQFHTVIIVKCLDYKKSSFLKKNMEINFNINVSFQLSLYLSDVQTVS